MGVACAVLVVESNLLTCKHWQGECLAHRLIGSVDSADVPASGIHVLAGNDSIAGRVAVDELCVTPLNGYAVEEVFLEEVQIVDYVRRYSHAVDAGLVGDGCGELKQSAGVAAVAALVVLAHVVVHDDSAPVETCHGIAGKRMHRQLESFGFGMVLVEHDVLAG